MKQLTRENESLSSKLANNQLADVMDKQTYRRCNCRFSSVDVKDNNALRQMMDEMKQKLSKGIIVLGAAANGKVMLVAGVTDDLKIGNYHAGKLVNHVATQCDGKRWRKTRYGNGGCERCIKT